MANKKKILEVIQPVDGGSAHHVCQLLAGLDKNIFDVHLAAPYHMDYDRLCKEHKIPYYKVGLQRSRNPLSDVKPFWDLYMLCRRERFDVIHLHCTKAGLLGRFIAKLCRVHCVYTPHGFIYSQPAPKIFQSIYYWLERLTLPLVRRVIFVSTSEAKVAVDDHIVSRKRTVTIPNGVNTALRLVPASRNVVVMVSRLEEPKRPEDLVQAVPFVISSHPDVRFIIVGDGYKRFDLVNAAKKLGVSDYIEFAGFRSNVEDYLMQSSLAVISSVSEGLPYVALEAMACQRPVIGSKVKGIVDVVKDGQTGLLYELGNGRDLANKITFLLSQPQLAAQYGRNGRQLVQDRYSLETMVQAISSLYLSL